MQARSDTVWDWIGRNHGLLTTTDGVAAFGAKGFRTLIRDGRIVLVYRGIYRIAGAPVTPLQELLALTWALNGVASHKTAGWMHGIGGFTLNQLHLLRLSAGTPSRGLGELKVEFHYSNCLPPHHVETIDCIQTTTLPRTLCDLSAVCGQDRLGRIIDDSKRRGLVDYEEVAVCRNEIRARGRRKTVMLDRLLEERVPGFNPGESHPEKKVVGWLTDAGYEPVVQQWVVANGRRRRLDAGLLPWKVAIEYQGVDEHGTFTAVVNDAEKITDLQLAGFFVVLVSKKTTRAEFLRNVADAIRIQTEAGRHF